MKWLSARCILKLLTCRGTGLVFGGNPVKCTLCKGKGRILPPGCYGRLVVAKNPFPDESTGVKILAHKSRYGIKAIGWPMVGDELRSLVAWKDGKPVTHPPPEDLKP